MPRTLAWGRSIDPLELNPNSARRLGHPRLWEIRSKRGGAHIGNVTWHGPTRAYIFTPLVLAIPSDILIDIGKFCQNHTESMEAERRKAAG